MLCEVLHCLAEKKQRLLIFDVLLTLHLSNLSQYLTNLMHKIFFTINFISCLYMFRAHVLIQIHTNFTTIRSYL